MTFDDERPSIRRELDTLRKNGARRQELSLYACKRLFFDFGIRPSMTAVRDLTQTGSASDIPKDIELFWQRIRAASKVRVGAGIIPAALEDKAGELLGQLYDMALSQAREALDQERAEIRTVRLQADQNVREAEIRRAATDEMLLRSEARAEAASNRVRELETQLAATTTHGALQHGQFKDAVQRLKDENAALQKRIDTQQSAGAAQRERIDALHEELRRNTEHYAQQIKDALAEAEQRVKPMLVELDSLRSMASTWQKAQRDAGRKEFDFIQQLAAAKARGDQLDAQLRERTDEIGALTHQMSTLRDQQTTNPSVVEVLYAQALAGRLQADEFRRLGASVDDYVTLPLRCPRCHEGEPELSRVGHGYEIACPECDYSSGERRSKLEAVARFMSAQAGRPAAMP